MARVLECRDRVECVNLAGVFVSLDFCFRHWQFPATTCELISRLRAWRDTLLGQVQLVSSVLKLERHSLALRDFSSTGTSVEVPGQYVVGVSLDHPAAHVKIASFEPGNGASVMRAAWQRTGKPDAVLVLWILPRRVVSLLFSYFFEFCCRCVQV